MASDRSRCADRPVIRAWARSHAVIDAEASTAHQPLASKAPTASAMRASSRSRRAIASTSDSRSTGTSSVLDHRRQVLRTRSQSYTCSSYHRKGYSYISIESH